MAQRIFTGFSTIGAHKSRQRTFYDVDLVKRDLTNHFYTRVGERVGRPDWGCIIWNLIMEQLTPGVKSQIRDEIVRIVAEDQRCSLAELNIIEIPNGVTIQLTIDIAVIGARDTLTLNFERREAVRWDGGY